MSERKIPVAETFYSIQGEGPHAGTPAVFLRLAGCNLCCGGYENMERDSQEDMEPLDDATWVCDTIDTWRDAEDVYTPEELVEKWEENGWVEKMKQGAHLILTGGEPTLPGPQKQIPSLIATLLSKHNLKPFIEVETNGTIEPSEIWFMRYIDHYNVSVKLSNSGMPREERIDEDAISYYSTLEEVQESCTAQFKFVVSREEDIEEIAELVGMFEIPDSQISLMPAGYSQEDLELTYPEVAELCKQYGWDFSPRLHVEIWDQATGV